MRISNLLVTFILILPLALFHVRAASAQIPDSLALLPGAKEQESVFYLSKGNIESFKGVLLAPVAEWIDDGRMVASVRRELSFEWRLASDWESATSRAQELYELGDDGTLVFRTPPTSMSGFPFGRESMINKESNPERRGMMILWNVLSATRSTPDVLYGLNLSWLSSQGLLRKASGFHFYSTDFTQTMRSATAASSAPGGELTGAVDPIFFRELFKLFAPSVVSGYSITTWRYTGKSDDDVWIHSPVIGRTRRVLGANRSDSVLGSAVMADDLFVFSAKPQKFSARVVEEKVILLPFASLRMAEVKPRALTKGAQVVEPAAGLPPAAGSSSAVPGAALAGGDNLMTVSELFSRRDNSFAFVLWNHETGRFPQAAAWLPTTVTFVPRRVWVVELEPREPFYLTGKQVLIVDQESMLPFYKLVYEQNGSYKKTVFGAWALAADVSGTLRFPFLACIVSVEHQSKVATTLTTDSVRSFAGRETKQSIDLYQQLMAPQSPATSGATSSRGGEVATQEATSPVSETAPASAATETGVEDIPND